MRTRPSFGTGRGLTYEALLQYVDHLNTEHDGKRLSAAAFNVKLAAAKKRIRYLFEHSPDAFDTLKRLQIEKALGDLKPKKINSVAVPREKTLTPNEIRRLSGALQNRGDIPGGPTIGLLVEFMFHTGTRISEALGVLISDLKKPKGRNYFEVRIRGKGNRERTVFAEGKLIHRINDHRRGTTYLFEHSGKPYHRIYVTSQIKLAGRIYLERDISAHTLRHSFVTERLAKGDTVKMVSRYVGHASAKTTADMYDHNELTPSDLGL